MYSVGLLQLNTCVGKNVGLGPFSEILASEAIERGSCMLGSLSPKESGISVLKLVIYVYAQLVSKYECPRNMNGVQCHGIVKVNRLLCCLLHSFYWAYTFAFFITQM